MWKEEEKKNERREKIKQRSAMEKVQWLCLALLPDK